MTSAFDQVGDYALSQRVAAYIWRAVQFFGLGFGSSAVGHTLTKFMVRHADTSPGLQTHEHGKHQPLRRCDARL